MDDLGARVGKADFAESGTDFILPADEQHGRDAAVGFEGWFDAFDGNHATVVTPHDIQRDSHS